MRYYDWTTYKRPARSGHDYQRLYASWSMALIAGSTFLVGLALGGGLEAFSVWATSHGW